MTWGLYLREGICNRLVHLGERLNAPWLIYNPLLFRRFHELALKNAPPVMRTLEQVFPKAQRYVDVGSGSGAFAAEAQRRGRQVIACEHGPTGRRMARRQGVDCRPFDLNQDPPAELSGTFDLAYCFEVAEHLPDAFGRKLVKFIASLAPTIVFTAAQPGQLGQGHINEQPKQYWADRFIEQGFVFRQDLTEVVSDGFRREGTASDWMVRNVLVLEKPDE